MAKRKRPSERNAVNAKGITVLENSNHQSGKYPVTIQIIAGSYERVLHGITATISTDDKVGFYEAFLLTAHASALKCLAVSPPSAPVPGQTQKIILASGSTDERINLYQLSAHAPRITNQPTLPSLTTQAIVEDPQNRELGTLLHHSSSVTALHFPTRSNLLSAGEDSTIAITRTRDWSLLSTIKVPIPKPQGRPSGDTAPPGGTPAGVNDFAVHPSLKLMISVGKGERCMRLWNLVTGKKAGVLNFEREVLSQAGEGRHSSGEGRKVAWGSTEAGEEFCVGFERGVLVFGMNSKPRCKVITEPRTKVHQLCYICLSEDLDISVIALSTEDGRILFYSTRASDIVAVPAVEEEETPLPSAKLIAQLGGKEVGLMGRIKDFNVLQPPGMEGQRIIVGGSSDGAIRLWRISLAELLSHSQATPTQIGDLLGTYETGNRITCLAGYVMLGQADGEEEAEQDQVDEDDKGGSSSSNSA